MTASPRSKRILARLHSQRDAMIARRRRLVAQHDARNDVTRALTRLTTRIIRMELRQCS